MIGVLLDFTGDYPHLCQRDRLLVIVVDIALEHLQYVQPVTWIGHEGGEQDVQAVVDRDELVPIANRSPEFRLVTSEGGLVEIVALGRRDDVVRRDPRTVHGHADAAGEDRVHEPGGVTDHQPLVAADIPHRIAVVTFWAELPDTGARAQCGGEFRAAFHGFPEEALPILFRSSEMLLLRYDPDTGDSFGDRDLPHPRVCDRQKVNEN